MNRMRPPELSADAFRWRQLRRDSGCFESLTDCIEACLPEFRRCAQLFMNDIAAGDRLAEDFLSEVLAVRKPPDMWYSPAGLTALFEHFITARFTGRPPLPAAKSGIGHVYESADDFLATLAKG